LYTCIVIRGRLTHKHWPWGQTFCNSLFLFIFAAKFLQRAGLTLHEVQTHLDREGASDLVVELIIKSAAASAAAASMSGSSGGGGGGGGVNVRS